MTEQTCKTMQLIVLNYDDVAKNYKVKVTQANFYVRRTTVSDQVFTVIEKTLTPHLRLNHLYLHHKQFKMNQFIPLSSK